MERDGSGVSPLLGLDGFVVSAQCSTRRAASGGSRWRPPRIGPGASPAACERSAMAAARSWWICRSQIGRWCWCGPSACGAAPSRRVRPGPGRRSPRRSRHGPRDRAGSGGDRSWCRSAEHSVAQAARDFGVLWYAAMAAVRDHGRPRVDHLARLGAPSAVGLDETSFLAGTAEHPTVVEMVCPDGSVGGCVWPSRVCRRRPTGHSRGPLRQPRRPAHRDRSIRGPAEGPRVSCLQVDLGRCTSDAGVGRGIGELRRRVDGQRGVVAVSISRSEGKRSEPDDGAGQTVKAVT